jgi:hypothetical protein
MKTRIIAIVLCIALALPVVGCSTIEEHPGTAVGAGVGGAAGAIAGSAIGEGGTTGAVVGGLLGALVGGAIGYYAYDRERTADETARVYNYQPAQGSMLDIEDASVTPQVIRPGEQVDLKMTYALLTPTRTGTTRVTELREIRHEGELVGQPKVTVERADGTYTSSIPLRLPDNAAPGTYRVIETVETPFGRDSRETSFEVASAGSFGTSPRGTYEAPPARGGY